MRQMNVVPGVVLSIVTILIVISCNNPNSTSSTDSIHDSIDAKISRGEYLVTTICNCMHCHADRDYTKFAGPVIPGTEGKGGEEIESGIFVRNITPFGIGSLTDEELFKVITTGIRKNGDTLVSIMPYLSYARMPSEEIYSIIAYLRTLKPIKNPVPEQNIPAHEKPFWADYESLYLRHASEKIPLPDTGDMVARGKYLVNAGACSDCHTRYDMDEMDYDYDMYMAGGYLFVDSTLNIKVHAANLTPDSATGIGSWSEDVFVSKFKNFRNAKNYDYDPGKFNTFMPWTILAQVKDEDLKAIYAYLRTITPIENKLEKWPQ